jgi:hypothetical protein
LTNPAEVPDTERYLEDLVIAGERALSAEPNSLERDHAIKLMILQTERLRAIARKPAGSETGLKRIVCFLRPRQA